MLGTDCAVGEGAGSTFGREPISPARAAATVSRRLDKSVDLLNTWPACHPGNSPAGWDAAVNRMSGSPACSARMVSASLRTRPLSEAGVEQNEPR